MRVGILLLNWNTWEVSQSCLHSLRLLDHPAWKVVVVDNNSVDGSADQIAEAFPEVELLRQHENLGFAGGNNVGMRYLLDAGAEAVWILNNDTVVDPACLDCLLAELEQDPGVGVVTHRIDYVDPPGRLWYAGGTIRGHSLRATHDRQGLPVSEAGVARDVDFVCACSQLVRREVLEQLGGFNDSFFAYCEDVDWCLRARAAGVRMRYLPEPVIVHLVSAATRKNTLGSEGGSISAVAHYLNARNRTYLLRLHARGWRALSGWTIWAMFHAWLWLGLSLKRRQGKLKALRRGLRDGRRRPLRMVEAGEFSATTEGAVPASWDG